MSITEFKAFLGASHYTGSHAEKWISALGASIGIASFGLMMVVLQAVDVLPERDTLFWLAPCFGASCVLLFTVPHSPFSQPWPVIGGFIVSALAGVVSVKLLDKEVAQASLAVGSSVLLMYYLRCLHPPGGAATIIPVVTGTSDWSFVLNPILLGAICLLWVAIIFNAFFPWRRYPTALLANNKSKGVGDGIDKQSAIALNHEDVSWAIQKMDSFTDITPEELSHLFELAARHQTRSQPTIRDFASHNFYSNGRTGLAWQVYEVVAVTSNVLGQRSVTYRVVAGSNKGYEEDLVLQQFLVLAVIPVIRESGLWVRLTR